MKAHVLDQSRDRVVVTIGKGFRDFRSAPSPASYFNGGW